MWIRSRDVWLRRPGRAAGLALWAGLVAALSAPSATAATPAGTEIVAEAQLVYDGAAGTAQTASFRVDRLIQFTWTPASSAATDADGWPDPANDEDAISFDSLDAQPSLSFTLTNTGNETAAYRFFVLSNPDTVSSSAPEGQIDFIGALGATVHVALEGAVGDDVDLSTAFDAGAVPGTASADVPPGESLTVVADITLPGSATYDSDGVFALAAQAVQPGTFQVESSGTPSSGAPFVVSAENTLGAADVIFTDGDGDGVVSGAPLADAFGDTATNGVAIAVTSLTVVPVSFGFARAVAGLQAGLSEEQCADLTTAITAFDETEGGAEYFVPGACIEQTVTLSLASAGITIEDISVSEAFPQTLTLLNAGLTGLEAVNVDVTNNTLLAAATAAGSETGFVTDTPYTLRSGNMTLTCGAEESEPCTITVTNMSLAGPAEEGDAATTGVIRLRHWVK